MLFKLKLLKYHQSDLQSKRNDKFAHTKLALKAQLKDSAVISPIPITTDLIMLPASQRAHTFIIQEILFIYTYFISKFTNSS